MRTSASINGSSCSARPPSSTSTSTIGTQQPDQRSSAWNTAAVTKMELMLNETSKFDQYIDDWDKAARPAQQRLEHNGRREDGAHAQRDLQVRPVHRRLGHNSPTSTAVLGTQRPSRRWSSCSTRPPSLTSAATIGRRAEEWHGFCPASALDGHGHAQRPLRYASSSTAPTRTS